MFLKKFKTLNGKLIFFFLILFQFFLILPKFIELRKIWTYSIYYYFVPYYIVFLILILIINIHKLKKDLTIFYENIYKQNQYFWLIFFIILFLISFSFSINSFTNFIFSEYIFFISQIFLSISFSLLCIKKNYFKPFLKFFLLLTIIFPLPYYKNEFLLLEPKMLNETEKNQLIKNLLFMKNILLIMITLVFILFIILVIHRKINERKNKIKSILKEKYSFIINNYLYDEISLEEAISQFKPINYPIYLMTSDEILNVIKGEFKDKIIKLSKELSVYKFLLEEAKNKKWWKKVKALYHLGRLEYYDGLNNNFFEKMLNDKSADVRAATIVALSNLDNEKSIKIIAKYLFSDNSLVREKAREVIIKFGKKAYNTIIELLENEKNEINIVHLLEIIAIINDYTFIEKIDYYINHSNLNIVAAAINIASELEYPINIETLKNLLDKNNDLLTKIILKNIYKISDDNIIDYIKKYITHKDWSIRYFTAVGLYKLGKKGKEELQNIIMNSTDKYAVDMAYMVIDELSLT